MTLREQCLVAVSETGSLDLPSDVRQFLGLVGAGRVILRRDEMGIHILPVPSSLDQVWALALPFRPQSGWASDELIADRRREAAFEAGAGSETD